MTEDYDDPVVEARWLEEQRKHVLDYLDEQEVRHGGVPEQPAWFVTPYLSIWSAPGVAPANSGFWIICGDVPADFLPADEARDAREAMRAFASRWRELSAYMARGERHPAMHISYPRRQPELGELLRTRAETLKQWADDDSIWRDSD